MKYFIHLTLCFDDFFHQIEVVLCKTVQNHCVFTNFSGFFLQDFSRQIEVV